MIRPNENDFTFGFSELVVWEDYPRLRNAITAFPNHLMLYDIGGYPTAWAVAGDTALQLFKSFEGFINEEWKSHLDEIQTYSVVIFVED